MKERIEKKYITANLPAHLVEWLQGSAKKNYRSVTRELQRCLEECMRNDKAEA
ncbi:hypothetical protein [Pasteurella multocida]|uniref:hypothetical protein n=1 Tax=Pasteurella multocida TaxID=747 RepID=UPI00131BB353|nr:hypothetical protein [Pasteurella multocida]MCW4597969.1 hypothetical protein [Pasteurella multocida subsp. multocida]MEB3468186.1 hypothetical protein [Pasteurella multocida]MEB3485177.1 hypothetical protein [Pasteurella multocida]MEB3494531.1 hypothetical protein [Pasteurella multocida]MEB3499939.1 hypothetical protein [Pasteurella multocida]